jgi:hypothetical protein
MKDGKAKDLTQRALRAAESAERLCQPAAGAIGKFATDA